MGWARVAFGQSSTLWLPATTAGARVSNAVVRDLLSSVDTRSLSSLSLIGASVVVGAAVVSFAISAGSAPFVAEAVVDSSGTTVELQPAGFVQLLLGNSENRAGRDGAEGVLRSA